MTPHDQAPPGPAAGAEPASPAPQPVYKRSGSQKRQRNKFWVTALTEEEEARALEIASRLELSKCAYGRLGLLGTPGPRARRKPHIHAQLMSDAIAALNRSGNVLNQMQHSLNAGGAVILGRECSEALAANRRAADAILEALGRRERDDDYQGEPAQ
jgi:hypothetical protein